MLTVLICSIVNSGLILGLLAGIAVSFVRSWGAITSALRSEPQPPRLRQSAAAPVRPVLA